MINDLNLGDLVSDSLGSIKLFIEDSKLKKIRRKFRRNGKIIYTKYLITYNPVRDLMLDGLSFNLRMIRKSLNILSNKQ